MMDFYTSEQIIQLKDYIIHSQEIVIISHTNPDGDAVGAALGFYNALKSQGIKSRVILPNPFPEYYKFLRGSENICTASEKPEECAAIISNAELIIAVDFNALSRISQLETEVKKSSAKKVLIDHHVYPETNILDIVFSRINISSASEYAYWILKEIFGENFLDKETAECIYTGICTDTGSFSYSCNYSSTYHVLIHLLEAGVDGEELHYKIYNTFSEKRLRLLGYCLSEKMKVLQDIGAAYITLSKEELERFDYQVGDTEGIVNYTLMIGNVNVGVLMAEFPGKIRMSFRSKNNFDVNLFSRKYFNGGGHRKASGGSSYKSMEKTVILLEQALQESIIKK